jgi:3-isopropylmalate/(R)-2-methylmalate dehydratase small subunit
MQPVGIIRATMAPMPRANVDTDQIIPKQFLKRIERSGFGPYLFYDWARDVEGEPEPGFVLNQDAYRSAAVLVAGPNFGTGSSREHAVWALEDWGFRAVIAPSFADIFFTNCFKIGLLPVVLTDTEVSALSSLATEHPAAGVVIDLAAQTVTAEGVDATFEIDPATKHRLLNGLDDIALTLHHAAAVDSYEAARPGFKPTVG